MAWNLPLLMNDPEYWGTNLPQSDDPQYGNDIGAWLDAVKAAHDSDPNNSGLAYAAPSTYTGADGQQMSAAGYTQHRTPGEQAAAPYNWHMVQQALHHGVRGGVAGGTLDLMSRMALHPEEAQAAYGAYELDPDTGLPVAVLNDAIINLMEQQGIRPTPNPLGGPGLGTGGDGPMAGRSATGNRDRGTQRSVTGSRDRNTEKMPAPSFTKTPVDGTTPYVMQPDQQMHIMGDGGIIPSSLTTMHPDYPDFILKYIKNRQGGPIAPTRKDMPLDPDAWTNSFTGKTVPFYAGNRHSASWAKLSGVSGY